DLRVVAPPRDRNHAVAGYEFRFPLQDFLSMTSCI
ncbi:MAG: hypothetical protein ACJAUL_000184, partial [Paraglaciecola sp.]